MPLSPEATRFFNKHVTRHGYLSDELREHLFTGVKAKQITAGELRELGLRIRQHIADKKGTAEHDPAVEALKVLERQALRKQPAQALSHLLQGIPKSTATLIKAAAAVGRAIKLVRVKPSAERKWHAIVLAGDATVQVAKAAPKDWKRFAPDRAKYSDYIERMLNRKSFNPQTHGFEHRLNNDEIKRMFPGRAELFHLHFPPHMYISPSYVSGEKKVPILVIEPLIKIGENERQAAVETMQAGGYVTQGALVGHRLHVFDERDMEAVAKLARKMKKFFRHDIQILQHFT